MSKFAARGKKLARNYLPKPVQRVFWRYSYGKQAKRSKTLDIAAASLSWLLTNSNTKISLKGKRCLEIGCGATISYSIVFWLLGAKKVLATDIERLADIKFVRNSLKQTAIVGDVLWPHVDRESLMKRLNWLKNTKISFPTFSSVGIDYRAPVDFSDRRAASKLGMFDFILSNVVLEHVYPNDLEDLLTNLSSLLAPNGIMVHWVHLEDHEDYENNPFAFFTDSEWTRSDCYARGNRIRPSQYLEILNQISSLTTIVPIHWFRNDDSLPPVIDSSVKYRDEKDLRSTHILLVSQLNNKSR